MTVNEIKGYEAMAKLNLPDCELEWALSAAETLEASFSALQGIDTEGVEPIVTVLDLKNIFRDDVSFKMLPREVILKNAPEQSGSYFKVPRTIE